MIITSKNNELIKHISKLKDKKYRALYKEFLVEGKKIIAEAVKSGYDILYFIRIEGCEYSVDNSSEIIVSSNIIEHLSTTKSPQDCLAVVKMRDICSENFDGRCIILDNVQDPSNVGAIIRTALGANFDNVILLNCADIYDTKVIRSSMGALFHINIFNSSTSRLIQIHRSKVNNFVCCDMDGENVFHTEFPPNILLIVGNEGNGVDDALRRICSKTVSVPMNSKLESLNASVSAGIIMYVISQKSLGGKI